MSLYCMLFVIICFSSANSLYFHIAETDKKCFIEEIPDETLVVGKYKVEMFDKASNTYVPTVYGFGMHVEIRDPNEGIVLSRAQRRLKMCRWNDWLEHRATHSSNYKVQAYDYTVKEYLPSAPGIGMHVEIRDPDEGIVLSRTYASEGRFTFTSHAAGEHVICLHSNSTAWFSSGQLRVHLDIQIGEHAVDYQQIQAKDKLSELQLRVRQLLDQVEMITKEQNYQRYREERFRETSESTNQRVLWWSISQTIILLITGFWQMKHLRSFFEAKKLV